MVKKSFIESLERELMAALSLTYVVELGVSHFEKNKEELIGKFRHGFISISEPELGAFTNPNVAVEDAYNFVISNPELVIEIFHGLMIQSWFQFLSSLHREMVYSMLHGTGAFPLNKVKIQIDPSFLSKNYLPDSIFHSICDEFDFRDANEKFRIVAKGLGKKVEELDPEFTIIRQEVLVRNLIQHNKGVIRLDDIRKNSNKPFTRVDITAGRTEHFVAGKRIQRDMHDLRKLAGTFYQISEKLLSSTSL